MKICNKCNCEKELSEFNKNKSKKDGHNATCRECMKILLREHYNQNKQDYFKRNNVNRIKRLEELAGRVKPDTCEVCGKLGKICWDHDHETGKFRGWLCSDCNLALGKVNDNVETLLKLAEYIKNSRDIV